MAAVRGQRDIAVGNVVGSNIFQRRRRAGCFGLVAPSGIPVHASALSFDLPVMIAVSRWPACRSSSPAAGSPAGRARCSSACTRYLVTSFRGAAARGP